LWSTSNLRLEVKGRERWKGKGKRRGKEREERKRFQSLFQPWNSKLKFEVCNSKLILNCFEARLLTHVFENLGGFRGNSNFCNVIVLENCGIKTITFGVAHKWRHTFGMKFTFFVKTVRKQVNYIKGNS